MVKKIKLFTSYNKKELSAATNVIKSGKLSSFVAHKNGFYGGNFVQKFERKLSNYFGAKYAVTFNSWTSGLIAAVGAIDIEPGDEILVPTWTMCATATAIIHFNAIPIFVDINPDDYNICITDLKRKITKKTKAIIAVDINGYPSDIKELISISKKNKIKLIFDSAQSIGAKYNKKLVGSFGDISGFSFNYHKHIHTGEGGVCLTNKKQLYDKLCLIRNHGEILMKTSKKRNLSNIIGYNFRLGEIESAIGIEQLKKLKKIVKFRADHTKTIISELKKLKGLILPNLKKKNDPSHYTMPLRISDAIIKKVGRKKLVKKLKSNGVYCISQGYMNLHLMSMYKYKIAYGSKGFPWNIFDKDNIVNYSKGICPNAEKLHFHSYLAFSPFYYEMSKREIKFLLNGFIKTWQQLKLNDL